MLLVSVLAGCWRPLPEEGSADAELYRQHCGTCHAAYQPRSLTPLMWKVQAERMYPLYRGAGQPVPTSVERDRILQYLTRHSYGSAPATK